MGRDELSGAAALDILAERALSTDPALPCLEYERRWFSWGEVQHVAARLRSALGATGAGERQPVAFIPRNRPSALAALLALIAERRTIQMIYAFQSPAAIAQNIVRLAPAIVVAGRSELTGEVVDVLRAGGSAAIAIEDMDAHALPGFERSERTSNAGAPEQPQIQVLTSGTTGAPKQVPFPYRLFEQHYAQPGRPASHADPPPLLCFPLGNISGIYSSLPPLFRGQRVVLLDRFELAAWHDWVVRFRPINGGLPPAGVRMILDANIAREDLRSIKFVGTGAAPLDPAVQREFEERYGIPILLSYGATEFGGPVVSMTPELHARWGRDKLGSVGRPMPGAKIRVVDPETGRELPPREDGLLEVVSPRVGPDWIRTSDLAMIDEDGFMFHRGRADGAIVRGGFKLVPDSIERALCSHPAVAGAVVVARPDQRLGQVPVAAIQLRTGALWPGDEALVQHLRKHVPATHIPVAWLDVDELPRTRSMKIDRPAVQRLFEARSACS